MRYWEWDVDPLTRRVLVPPDDVRDVADFLFGSGPHGPIGDWSVSPEEGLVLQNAKFDFMALATIGLWDHYDLDTVWLARRDTLRAAHILNSQGSHNLTDLALIYLDENIEQYELALERCCKEARDYCRKHLPNWRIASDKLPEMPSAGEKTWKYDGWLPRALAKELNYPEDHPYRTVLRDYANVDSQVTAALWTVMCAEIRRQGLWEIYHTALRVDQVVMEMETRGITHSEARLDRLTVEYSVRADECNANLVALSKKFNHRVPCPRKDLITHDRVPCRLNCDANRTVPYVLEPPKGGVNDSLRVLAYDLLRLEEVVVNKKSKTGAPSLDKEVLEMYRNVYQVGSDQHNFAVWLSDKRKRDTAVSYMESYRRFRVPLVNERGRRVKGWYVLHPHLNSTATGTLRFGCQNPNEQNISKKEGFNLRYAFGPAPGREWWALDAENIELRIPAYESGEEQFIALFERPNDPPYFGSNHLLIAHLLWKEEFESCVDERGRVDGRIFKERYKSTKYQDTKNGNFAVQYGSVDRADGRGTADRTYKKPGAQAMIAGKFAKQDKLNKKWIQFAREHGYVETLPDRTVNPHRGYPIRCSPTEWGEIKPTVPLNYHVQGTAMWWTIKAMLRCQAQLDLWRERSGFDGFLIIQVHDELVFDFPRSAAHPKEDPKRSNLPRVRVLQELMAEGGNDIGIPTTVGVEYCPHNWSEGVKL